MDNMVQILVPEKYVVAVYGFVAELEQRGGGEEPHATPPVDSPQLNGHSAHEEWSPKQLRLMYDQSPPAMVRILDYLADNPDKEVPSSELVKALGTNADGTKEATSNTLAGTLGAFGRRVLNRYSKEHWPFEAYYSHEQGSLVYYMDGWVAEKLRSYKTS